VDALSAPAGFSYAEGFLSPAEELALAEAFDSFDWELVRMRGMTAKRRTKHFGWLYGYESFKVAPGPPLPAFLVYLRARAAAWAGVPPGELEETLVSEYRPGAAIGWHRDAPAFGEPVVGVSLMSACRLRFRRGRVGAWTLYETTLAPRSIYALAGDARRVWQHHIPGSEALRYSATFRPLRAKAARRANTIAVSSPYTGAQRSGGMNTAQ
jgi:alkylated DNA repair protein (DNA oxidative demethylase)